MKILLVCAGGFSTSILMKKITSAVMDRKDAKDTFRKRKK